MNVDSKYIYLKCQKGLKALKGLFDVNQKVMFSLELDMVKR